MQNALNAQLNPGNSSGVDSPCHLTHLIPGADGDRERRIHPNRLHYRAFLHEDCRCLVDIQ
jgi:hypothetical protein